MHQIIGVTYAADFRSQHGRVTLYLENKSMSERELRNVLLDMPNVEYLSVKSKSAVSSSIAGVMEASFTIAHITFTLIIIIIIIIIIIKLYNRWRIEIMLHY